MKLSDFYNRLYKNWTIEEALGLVEHSDPVVFQGVEYSSPQKLAEAFGISYNAYCARLKSGWSLEETLGVIPRHGSGYNNNPGTTCEIVFNGVKYRSDRELAKAYEVEYPTYKSRIAHGWSQEEALGVVLRLPSDPTLAGKEFSIGQSCPFVKYTFASNPYCVLGISALATKKEALDISYKLEKYNKLAIQNKYRSDFDLVNMETPGREMGQVQIAMVNLDKIDHRWMWFAESKYARVWNQRVIDAFLRKDCSKTYSYDELLVCLYNGFISDPEFKNANKWHRLLHAVNDTLAKKDDELFAFVKQHVTEDDKKKYNYHMLVRSFRTALEGAFLINIASQGAAANCALLALIKEEEFSFSDKWIAEIATASITWINRDMQLISDTIKSINAKKSYITTEDSTSVVELLQAFDGKNGFDHLEQLASALEGIEMYAELMREKVRQTVWDATVIISKGGNKAAAARFDSKIYFYCNDEQKKQIKAVYPAEMLCIPESEFSADECEKAAMRFDEAGNYSSAFEWYMRAANKGKASSMNSIGVAYALGHGVTQSEEKAVLWYKKAASHDDPHALYNLAIRMFNGTVPGGKSKAKEYWIRSFLQEQQTSVRSRLDTNFPGWHTERITQLNQPRYRWKHNLEPLAEAGLLHAQYLAGMRYHEGGFLWQRDDEKSKEWLLKAANGGFIDAKEYLLSKFGINVDMVDFDWDEDTEIVGDCAGMYIEFCGVRRAGNKYVLRFWAMNNAKHKRNLWLTGISINDVLVDSFEKIGEFVPEDSDWCEYSFELQKYGGIQKLKLKIEVDDENDNELATCCELEVTLNFVTKEVTFESTELEHNLGQITLSADDYCDTVICDGKVHCEFCGINLDAEEDCEFTFWFNNHLDRNICVWATGFKVDGNEHEDSPIKIGEIEARNCSHCSMTIPGIMSFLSYNFDMVIEIDDEMDEKLYDACSLHISLNGEGGIEEIHKCLEPIAAPKKKPPKPVQMSIWYTPGSRYVLNYEKNGIELYFSIIPPEMVRNALKS